MFPGTIVPIHLEHTLFRLIFVSTGSYAVPPRALKSCGRMSDVIKAMRKFLIVTVAIFAAPSIVSAQSISPPNCPPGYRCVPDDSRNGLFRDDRQTFEDEQAEQSRIQCENNKRLNEELAVGQAAQAYPGNPYAVSSALAMSRLNSCR